MNLCDKALINAVTNAVMVLSTINAVISYYQFLVHESLVLDDYIFLNKIQTYPNLFKPKISKDDDVHNLPQLTCTLMSPTITIINLD